MTEITGRVQGQDRDRRRRRDHDRRHADRERRRRCASKGVKGVWVFATHGVFCGGALEKFHDAPIDGIVVTDTVPINPLEMPPNMTVLPGRAAARRDDHERLRRRLRVGDLRRREPALLSRPFLIDTTPRPTTRVALLLALATRASTCARSPSSPATCRSSRACRTRSTRCELAGADVPVYAGAARPRVRELHTRPSRARRRRDGRHRPAAARPRARRGRSRAGARRRDPRAAGRGDARHARPADERRRGARARTGDRDAAPRRSSSWAGRRTPRQRHRRVAEYNVWADPEAAAIVFESGAPLTMVGWDVSRTYAVITPHDADELRALGPLGAFSVDIQRTLIEFCRDADAARRLRPARPDRDGDRARSRDRDATCDALHVAVETQGELTRGADGRRLPRHGEGAERGRRARGVTRALRRASARCAPRRAAPPRPPA